RERSFPRIMGVPRALAGLVAAVTELKPRRRDLPVLAGFRALDIRRFLTVIRCGWPAAVVMLITLIATLVLPLQRAVAVGVGVSFLLYVFRSVEEVRLREIVMTGGLPEERPAPRELPSDSVTVLLPYGSLFFAAAHALADALPRVGEA